MARIYVQFAGLQTMADNMRSIAKEVDKIKFDFMVTINNLDWEIKYASDINNTANRIEKKIENHQISLKKYASFIEDSGARYIKLNEYDKEINNYEKSESKSPSQDENDDKVPEWVKKLLPFRDEKEYENFLNYLKIIGSNEAGILRSAVSYFNDLFKFFSGDKKGLTGARDWFDLASSSASVWKYTYEYFCKTYNGLTTGFFGEVAQKNVKILGVSAGVLDLISSVISGFENFDEKKLQTKIADFLDSGKSVFSIYKAGYELKNFKDVKSLITKNGPWSPLDVYGAVVNSGVDTVSQALRSHEKYSADGVWDAKDTGATGVDASIAGIYSISHSLTLGLDDLIFAAVDKASGGNGTSEMSYVEKAAEGYKMLAEKIGQQVGSWWSNLTK